MMTDEKPVWTGKFLWGMTRANESTDDD